MAFLKHIGKLGNRKVVIVFREVPNEPHMCLIIYTETLKQSLHEALMRVVESEIGQRAESLADALNRSYSNEGEILLHTFHKEGLLKKVQTKMVLVTPTPTSSVSLEEMNKILTEMKQGEAATKRLADLDASAGMQTPSEIAKRHRAQQPIQNAPQSPQTAQTTPGLLDDAAMAQKLRNQSASMQLQANQLLAESARLLQEAEELSPTPKPVAEAEQPAPAVKKRPRKSAKTESVAESI